MQRNKHMPVRSCAACALQGGQALVETAIVAVLLSLLLLSSLVVLRQMDIRSASLQAAHALAMECTVRVAECAEPTGVSASLADDIRARYFGAVDAPLVTGDRLRTQASGHLLRPFWRNLDGQPLIESPDQIQVLSDGVSLDAGEKVATNRRTLATSGPFASIAWEQAGPNRFGFAPRQGLRVAQVQVSGDFQLLPEQAGGRPVLAAFKFGERSAVLVDSWNAQPDGSSLAAVEARIRSGSALDSSREGLLRLGYAPVKSLLKTFGLFGLEPTAERFRELPIDASIIPPDRHGQP